MEHLKSSHFHRYSRPSHSQRHNFNARLPRSSTAGFYNMYHHRSRMEYDRYHFHRGQHARNLPLHRDNSYKQSDQYLPTNISQSYSCSTSQPVKKSKQGINTKKLETRRRPLGTQKSNKTVLQTTVDRDKTKNVRLSYPQHSLTSVAFQRVSHRAASLARQGKINGAKRITSMLLLGQHNKNYSDLPKSLSELAEKYKPKNTNNEVPEPINSESSVHDISRVSQCNDISTCDEPIAENDTLLLKQEIVSISDDEYVAEPELNVPKLMHVYPEQTKNKVSDLINDKSSNCDELILERNQTRLLGELLSPSKNEYITSAQSQSIQNIKGTYRTSIKSDAFKKSCTPNNFKGQHDYKSAAISEKKLFKGCLSKEKARPISKANDAVPELLTEAQDNVSNVGPSLTSTVCESDKQTSDTIIKSLLELTATEEHLLSELQIIEEKIITLSSELEQWKNKKVQAQMKEQLLRSSRWELMEQLNGILESQESSTQSRQKITKPVKYELVEDIDNLSTPVANSPGLDVADQVFPAVSIVQYPYAYSELLH